MNIPLVNLRRQYEILDRQLQRAINVVMSRSEFILGPEVDAFEKKFASYVGAASCVGVASGTDAIWLTLEAMGIGPGDEVITQANTFISTVLPILRLGARPVLVDVDEETGSISPNCVEQAVSRRTRVIIPVHLYGYAADMPSLTQLVKRHSSTPVIIEDAAQAHGVRLSGRHLGCFGKAGAFSFYPGKNLGAYGDAGAIVTDDKALARKLKMLRNIGQRRKYHHYLLGHNSRLDTMQAAVLLVKLRYLDSWNKKRSRIAKRYRRLLAGIGDLRLPSRAFTENSTNWHLFVIQTSKRDALRRYLFAHGVHCGIHYPIPLHMQPALTSLGYNRGDFPVTEHRAKTILSVPMFPELTREEQEYIAQTVRRFFKHDYVARAVTDTTDV